jgi:hypothetical protein
MAVCIKVAEMQDLVRGRVVRIFLEDRWNYFDKKKDWFFVSVFYVGKKTYRTERKIPDKFAEKLKAKVFGEVT